MPAPRCRNHLGGARTSPGLSTLSCSFGCSCHSRSSFSTSGIGCGRRYRLAGRRRVKVLRSRRQCSRVWDIGSDRLSRWWCGRARIGRWGAGLAVRMYRWRDRARTTISSASRPPSPRFLGSSPWIVARPATETRTGQGTPRGSSESLDKRSKQWKGGRAYVSGCSTI